MDRLQRIKESHEEANDLYADNSMQNSDKIKDILETLFLEEDTDWLIQQAEKQQKANTPKPIEEWHEDDGDCLWWFFPIVEAPYCGNPLDSNFPDYVTHFTNFATPK